MSMKHFLVTLCLWGCLCFTMQLRAGELAQRILGTWQSDKERTVQSIQFPAKFSEEERAKAVSVFGKLVLMFGKEEIKVLKNASSKPGKQGSKYMVKKEEGSTLTLEVLATKEQQAHLMVIHFVGDDLYRTKLAGGAGYEYFVRIK